MLIVRAITPQLGAWPDRLINGLLSPGVWNPASSFVVSAPGGMMVRVGSGTPGDTAVVGGTTALAGTYLVLNPDGHVPGDVPIAVGDASNPRRDLVVLRQYDDSFDSSGRTEAVVEVVQGTPAASPSAPAVPAGAIALAEVLVDAGESTAISAGNLTDRRTRTAAAVGSRGVVGEVKSSTTFTGLATNTVVAELNGVRLEAGRRYRIEARTPRCDKATSGDTSAVVNAWVTRGTTGATLSGVVAYDGAKTSITGGASATRGVTAHPCSHTIVGDGLTQRIALVVGATDGSITSFGGNDWNNAYIVVTDLGLA